MLYKYYVEKNKYVEYNVFFFYHLDISDMLQWWMRGRHCQSQATLQWSEPEEGVVAHWSDDDGPLLLHTRPTVLWISVDVSYHHNTPRLTVTTLLSSSVSGHYMILCQ